jgi:hypothetical protein
MPQDERGETRTANVKRHLLAAVLLAGTACAGLFGTDYNNIEYLCCDWGPAMTLPGKTNAAAQFNDAEDEVYFLKQVTSFTRKKRLMKDVWSGRDYEDVGKGLSIWLCKMKPDGSDKTEIKELWKNPAYPIDTQAQTTWMNVNARTKKIVLSIVIGGQEIVGLWTMNLDGSQLKRIQESRKEEGGWSDFAHPSWTPNGQWVVFGKMIQKPDRRIGGIAKCTAEGSNTVYLTNDINDWMPRVSPLGNQIAYIHNVGAATRLYLMNNDGSNQHPLPNPDDKRWGTHGGVYPAWSPDGMRIFFVGIGDTIVESSSGKQIWLGECHPHPTGWAHWGKSGLVGYAIRGIIFSDLDSKVSKLIGSPRLVEGSGKAAADRW